MTANQERELVIELAAYKLFAWFSKKNFVQWMEEKFNPYISGETEQSDLAHEIDRKNLVKDIMNVIK